MLGIIVSRLLNVRGSPSRPPKASLNVLSSSLSLFFFSLFTTHQHAHIRSLLYFWSCLKLRPSMVSSARTHTHACVKNDRVFIVWVAPPPQEGILFIYFTFRAWDSERLLFLMEIPATGESGGRERKSLFPRDTRREVVVVSRANNDMTHTHQGNPFVFNYYNFHKVT